jgi:branched-chain amino acid transport system permease protein
MANPTSSKKRSHPFFLPGYWWLAIVLAALALAPLFLSEWLTVFVTEMLIMALFALAFNLLFGFTGLLSFGHAAYFSLGAYTTAMILIKVTPSIPLAFLVGFLVATFAAWIIGYLCVRLDEIYFAMLTLAFGMMIHTIIWQWDSLTGGADGLVGIPRPQFLFFNLSDNTPYYYFTLIVVVICAAILWLIINSPFGLTLKSIRENHERVEYLGINMKRYRLISFVISGFFCGVAGALFAPFEKAISPGIAFWTKSAEPVFMSLLGGMNIFFGPVAGAAIFMYLKEIISGYTEYWMFPLGAILILIVIFLPGGIFGFIRDTIFGLRERD